MRVVVKVGSSSITADSGELDDAAVVKLCGELADAREGGVTVWASTQVPHLVQKTLLETLGLPAHRVRVATPDVATPGVAATAVTTPAVETEAFVASDDDHVTVVARPASAFTAAVSVMVWPRWRRSIRPQ